MRTLKAIIALLFALTGILIGALNQQVVDINLIFTHYQARLGSGTAAVHAVRCDCSAAFWQASDFCFAERPNGMRINRQNSPNRPKDSKA